MENHPIIPGDNGKLTSIISYFSIIGWLIAYFALYPGNKTALSSYQLRQTLLFHLASMVVHYAIALLFVGTLATSDNGTSSVFTLGRIVDLAFFILWLIGIIGAIQGERKPIPLIGERAQSMFSGI